jgi:hypothetical protein
VQHQAQSHEPGTVLAIGRNCRPGNCVPSTDFELDCGVSVMAGKRALWVVVAIALLVLGFYLYGSSRTPAGQPPLESLTQSNVADFQQHFDAATPYTRILLLLSPT